MEKILSWFDDSNNIQWFKGHLLYFILAIAVIALIIWFLWYLSSKRRRNHFYFYLQYFAYKLGLRRTISRHWISRIHVHECYDPLVEFMPHKRIFFNDETIEQPNFVRKNVLLKLYRIADKLPDGVNLLILQTYRSRSKINEKWEQVVNEITKENPDMGRHETMRLAKFRADDPRNSFAGHVTGGAVDVALCDDNGVMFDYGTRFHEQSEEVMTDSKNITAEQRENRKKLVRLMSKQGFINAPTKWWHFSYGDRVWSAYKGRRHGGIYGSAEVEIDGKYCFTVPIHRITQDQHK